MRWTLFFLVVFVLAVPLAGNFASAALGISPAIKEYNFVPGDETKINYRVLADDLDKELKLSISGELADFVRISKDSIVGPGTFEVSFNIPEEAVKPGLNVIHVTVKEVPSEDQFIGTAISITAVVKIFVPYPGRYVESTLNIPDGNVDEKIPVEVHLINRGKEDVNVNVHVDFMSEGGDKVHTMLFEPVRISTTGDRYFRKFLDTTGYRPGDYLAEAVIDYGEIEKVSRNFRIGSLFVDIVNFTERLQKDKIQEYFVNVESRWNGDLKEVFADVNISNGVQEVGFRTPSIDLGAWERGVLVGFLDTEELEGVYDVEIVLNYAGEQTTASGKLAIVESEYLLVIGIVIGVLILLVVILLIIFVLKKTNRSLKGSKKRGK